MLDLIRIFLLQDLVRKEPHELIGEDAGTQ